MRKGTKGRKVRTKTFSLNLRYFVAIYSLFGRLWARKVLFWVKTAFLGQEVHYFMVHNAYHDENVCGHFCTCRKSANFYHPAHFYVLLPIGRVFFHGQTSVKDTSEQISDLKMIGSYIFTCLYPMTSLSKLSDH